MSPVASSSSWRIVVASPMLWQTSPAATVVAPCFAQSRPYLSAHFVKAAVRAAPSPVSANFASAF